MHGKTSMIHDRGEGLFAGLPSPFRATRYHSLVVARPRCRGAGGDRDSEDGEIMAVQHRRHPVSACSSTPSRCSPSTATACSIASCTACPPCPGRSPLSGRRSAGPRRRRAGHPGVEPATGGSGAVIVESIVTSMAPDGAINFAPMGVEWDEARIVLKPFLETTTFRNVRETRVAVVNLTDDVMLFVQGAIGSPQFPWTPATEVRGAVLEAACSWREIEVETIDDTPPRSRIETRVVHRGSAASSSGSTGRATRCSRPPSWRRGPT